MNKSPWKSSAIAIAATVALGLHASDASALALGRVTVQSALGEPFRGEIDIPEINADEAASLRASVASGAAFRAAGMELTPTIASLKISLQRRSDGRYFLRLTSDRAVNEPFLDLVLEANWSSGRVVRDYTMLFDPPNLRQAAPPVVTAQGPAPVAPRVAPAARALAPAAPRATPAAPAEAPARAQAQAPQADAPPAASARAPAADGQRVTVRPGETAGRIAATHKPPAISLDQMLVALLRANPDAFVSGNVNRLRAGAVLDLPSAEQAGATEPAEARQLLVAQSRDFNEFRRRLAEGAPTAAVAAADRQAGGRVQAQVEERAGGTTAADKLTLSKGAVQGKAAADAIARERAAQDAATRMAELNKNIAELNKLTAGATTPPAAAGKPGVPGAAGATTTPGVGPTVATGALPAPANPAPATPAAAAPAAPATVIAAAPATPAPAATAASPAGTPAGAAAPGATAAPTAGESAPATVAAAAAGTPGADPAVPAAPAAAVVPAVPAAAATPVKPPVVIPPPAETSLVDQVMQDPMLPAAAGGGLLALLLGFFLVRARQRKKAAQAESSFLESRAEPDSFFGASGGQRIDTAEGGSAVGSSMVYSASQLDAAGDVDPVAEADVYLAYGRDLQAEEILKEALRTTPERVAIHGKLLEIYAKRKEVKAFNKAAEEAFSLTRGQGAEWEHICTLGHEIDPDNALYTSGGSVPTTVSPATVSPATVAPAAVAAGLAAGAVAAGSAGVRAEPEAAAPQGVPPGLDLDLDLDLSPAAMAGVPTTPVAAPSLDDGLDFTDAPSASLPAASSAAAGLDVPASFELPPEPAAPAQAAPNDVGMIDFDLSALSLDLNAPPSYDQGDIAPPKLATPGTGDDAVTAGFEIDDGEDPLATKLALAEEFSAIGDPDGARSLAEEVRNEASGALKGRAERFLAELS